MSVCCKLEELQLEQIQFVSDAISKAHAFFNVAIMPPTPEFDLTHFPFLMLVHH